jgi:predicted metalloprotease with PDZ domain
VRTDRLIYDTTYSLTSYSDSGQAQYPNIYRRGAIVAGLLDIALIELSGGKRALREVVLDTIVTRTSPEIGDFFARYVCGAEHPPVREYFQKLGIKPIEADHGLPVRFELDPNATAEQVKLRDVWMGKKARIA